MRPFFFLVSLAATTMAQSTAVEHPLMCDLDRDGLPDLYSMAPGRDDVLLRNQGDGRFADVTTECGLGGQRSRAMEPGDFDQDGHADLLLVTETGELRFFRGSTGGVFARADEVGLELTGVGQAEWIDYDRDGWEDLRAEAAHGETVFFHNLEGLGFEKIELGLEGLAGSVAVTTPLAAPLAEADESAPQLGGRVALPRPGSGSGTQSSRTSGPSVAPVSTGGIETSQIDFTCAEAVRDASNRSACIQASTNPTLGMLYPLSQELYVHSASGFVGIGTMTPSAPLTVDGQAGVEVHAASTLRVSLNGGIPTLGGRVQAYTVFGDVVGAEIVGGGLTSGGALRLRDAADNSRVLLLAGTLSSAAATLSLRDEQTRETVTLTSGTASGRLTLRDAGSGTGRVRVALNSRNTGGGGVLDLYNDDNNVTATLRGGADSGGLVLANSGGAADTVELIGDAGNSEGQIILRDGNAGNTRDGIALRARHVFGSGEGGVMTALNGENVVTARVIGDDGTDAGRVTLREGTGNNSIAANLMANAGASVGELRLNEHDGSRSFWLTANELTGTNSSGVETLSLNRQSGDAVQQVSADGFVKAGCYVIGGAAVVPTQFNHLPGGGTITVTRVVAGAYDVDFGTNISARFPDATLEWSSAGRSIRVAPNGNILHVACYDSAGAFTEGNFWITIR